jgi:hypothetical protein
MWNASKEQLPGQRGIRIVLERSSSRVTYAEVIQQWQDDAGFRRFFNELLADAPFDAFRWETPPVTAATTTREFEFVLLDSPGLSRTPDKAAFAEHFVGAGMQTVIEFSNLGGDAVMIVPCPTGPLSAYCHLGAFVRQAPAPQQDALWQLVGAAMAQRLGARPVWLSTAGAGVAWLHVRLDDRPKYYGYAPYRATI